MLIATIQRENDPEPITLKDYLGCGYMPGSAGKLRRGLLDTLVSPLETNLPAGELRHTLKDVAVQSECGKHP